MRSSRCASPSADGRLTLALRRGDLATENLGEREVSENDGEDEV